MTDLEGIVLKIQDYKESDGLVWMVTPQGVVSVRARGIQKEKSKLRGIVQPFSYVSWTIQERNNRPSLLIQGKCLRLPSYLWQDLKSQAIAYVCRDLLLKTKINETLYRRFDLLLKALEDTEQTVAGKACLFLREVLILHGIQPYVDGCIVCHDTTRIETLSKVQGGFLCARCNHEKKMPKEELIRIRSLFKVKPQQEEYFLDMFEFEMKDFIYWCKWLEYYEQIRLKSLEFLQMVI